MTSMLPSPFLAVPVLLWLQQRPGTRFSLRLKQLETSVRDEEKVTAKSEVKGEQDHLSLPRTRDTWISVPF